MESGDIHIDAYAHVTDDISGIPFGHGQTHLRIKSPRGRNTIYRSFDQNHSGDANDGIHHGC